MDQNNIVQNSSPLTFADILRMFRGKVVMIIIVTLVLALLGGAAGGLLTILNKNYEATVNFHLTTQDGSKALIPLLSSDSFAEKLLLEDNGLPKKELCNEADYNDALAKIEAYNTALDNKQAAVKQSLIDASAFTVMESEYNALLEEYNRRFEELSIYLSVQDEIAKGESYAEKVKKYEENLAKAQKDLEDFTPQYIEARNAKVKSADAVVKAKDEVKRARDAANEASEKVLAPWREREDVKELIANITAAVTYEYAKIVDDINAETLTENAENQNAAFLVVTVNVADDKEMAEFIVERLKSRIPGFVEDNIERLTDFNDPRCTLISTFGDVAESGNPDLIKIVIKWAVAPAIIFLVIVCTIIITKGCLPADIFEKSPKKEKKSKKQEE